MVTPPTYVTFIVFTLRELGTLEISFNEKLELRSVLCNEREREPLHSLLVVMRVTPLVSHFECAFSYSIGGRGVDQLPVVGNGYAVVYGNTR